MQTIGGEKPCKYILPYRGTLCHTSCKFSLLISMEMWLMLEFCSVGLTLVWIYGLVNFSKSVFRISSLLQRDVLFPLHIIYISFRSEKIESVVFLVFLNLRKIYNDITFHRPTTVDFYLSMRFKSTLWKHSARVTYSFNLSKSHTEINRYDKLNTLKVEKVLFTMLSVCETVCIYLQIETLLWICV